MQPLVHATHGPSYLNVWDLPDDLVIELPLNRPIDEEARAFTSFLGTIAQKPHMCPIRYLNWRDMPKELKEECWHLVEVNQELIIFVIMTFWHACCSSNSNSTI